MHVVIPVALTINISRRWILPYCYRT